ncbi:MAG: hypothetical protein QXO16_08495 [Archaeoglobaceae archaeon]
MPLNEADTRARLVEPKLKVAGWTELAISREFHYSTNHPYTKGKIVLVGDRVQREKPKRVDYLLRYTDGFPIAVVEAEPEDGSKLKFLEEQKRIVEHLEAVQAKIKAIREAQAITDAGLQRLEQAILERAFRGEL